MAAKLNQSIGSMGGSVPVVGQHAGLGMVVSEEWSIPNRVVGLGMCLLCNSYLLFNCGLV